MFSIGRIACPHAGHADRGDRERVAVVLVLLLDVPVRVHAGGQVVVARRHVGDVDPLGVERRVVHVAVALAHALAQERAARVALEAEVGDEGAGVDRVGRAVRRGVALAVVHAEADLGPGDDLGGLRRVPERVFGRLPDVEVVVGVRVVEHHLRVLVVRDPLPVAGRRTRGERGPRGVRDLGAARARGFSNRFELLTGLKPFSQCDVVDDFACIGELKHGLKDFLVSRSVEILLDQ